VTAINYTGSYFWVMDTNFDTSSSCPLPLGNHSPYPADYYKDDSHGFIDLVIRSNYKACFANCSRAVTNNGAYKPVACLSANNSHVYVWVPEYRFCGVGDLEPYCGYLATIPFGDEYFSDWQIQLHDASYADITQFISKGFTVQFPIEDIEWPGLSIEKLREDVNICLNDTTR
jgi:hypothetical protein